ncbi:MAG: hypothetical protein K2X55_17315 [Burkholderiaceae bacterium]|nr:hypothetical protein [Burkholderiaceae bacterium]
MNDSIYTLMDALAIASVSMDKEGKSEPQNCWVADGGLFNIWVIAENGDRTLVRKNLTALLSSALTSSANHGARVRGLAHTYEAVPVEAAIDIK